MELAMRDYLLGVLSAVVAAVALAWKHGWRYHEVTGEPQGRPAASEYDEQCRSLLQDLKAMRDEALADAAKPANGFHLKLKNEWGPEWCPGPRVASQPAAQPTVPAFLFQPNVTLADALKAAYERGRVDGRATSVIDAYNAGRAAAYQAASNPSLN